MVNFDYIFQWKKHKGKSVREVLDTDPQYILWAHNNTDLKFIDNVIKAAHERRSTGKSRDFATRYGIVDCTGSMTNYPEPMLAYKSHLLGAAVGDALGSQSVGRLPRVRMDIESSGLVHPEKTVIVSLYDDAKRLQEAYYKKNRLQYGSRNIDTGGSQDKEPDSRTFTNYDEPSRGPKADSILAYGDEDTYSDGWGGPEY